MNRRSAYRLAAAGLLLAATCSFASAQQKAKAENVPDLPFEAVPGFIKMPANLYLGEGIGVATNSKGPRLRLHAKRSHAPLRIRSDRQVTSARSAQGLYGFVFAHAVRVDPQDNIWAVDEGTNMVIKFNPEGRVVMVLGHRPESGGRRMRALRRLRHAPARRGQPYTFNRPTDVAWDAAGDIFVSDGYGNSRVVKYDKNGQVH